ncbi:unnamed protein product [Diabrotica balteata]|uniref:Uncharacterized protein n=1 Tax=Diabrotica balteata TaxID=107213 RepID=A0A9N9T7B7_DIABA|nr:unnamed protein product [Diabrotica balteata]
MKMPPANIKKSPSIVGNAGAQKVKRNLKKEETSDDLEEWKKAKQLLKPKDQLELTDAELKEIIPKQLTSTNPQIPEGLIEWSYLQAAFVQLPSPGNMVKVFSQEGTLLHKDSEEARQQMVEMGIDPSEYFSSEVTLVPEEPEPSIHEQEPEPEVAEEEAAKEEDAESRVTVREEEEEEEKGPEPEKPEEPEEADEDEGEIAIEKKAPPKTGGKPRKLTNQFNFCERAALTYNNPTRSQETQTTPPPMASFSANVLQWVIYDAYQADYEVQEQERERERREKMGLPPKVVVKKTPQQLVDDMQGRLFEATKVLERMINQNTYNEMAKGMRERCDEMEDVISKHDKKLKEMCNIFKKRVSPVFVDTNHKIIVNEQEIRKNAELFEDDRNNIAEFYQNCTEGPEIMKCEVEHAINNAKIRKACGPPTELLKLI